MQKMITFIIHTRLTNCNECKPLISFNVANNKNLKIKAKYDLSGKDNFTNSEITASTFVNAAESPSNSYLQLSSQTNTPKNSTVGESVQFNVKITEKLASITYQVSVDN